MAFELLFGLNVVDEAGYQKYRDATLPLLTACGGYFRYDFAVSKVLKGEAQHLSTAYLLSSIRIEILKYACSRIRRTCVSAKRSSRRRWQAQHDWLSTSDSHPARSTKVRFRAAARCGSRTAVRRLMLLGASRPLG